MRKYQFLEMGAAVLAFLCLPLAGMAQTKQPTTAEPKKAKIMILQKEDGEYVVLDTTFLLEPGMTATQAVEKLKREHKSLKSLGARKVAGASFGSPKDIDAIHVIASKPNDSTKTKLFKITTADSHRDMVYRVNTSDSLFKEIRNKRAFFRSGDSINVVKIWGDKSLSVLRNTDGFTRTVTVDSLLNGKMTINVNSNLQHGVDSLVRTRIQIVNDMEAGRTRVLGLQKEGMLLTTGDYQIITINAGNDSRIIVLRHINTENSKKKKEKISQKHAEKKPQMEVQVYPNPTSGSLTLSFSVEERNNTKVRIVDSQGRAVFEDEKENFKGRYHMEIDLSKYGTGLFVIQLMVGKTVQAEKVLVQ